MGASQLKVIVMGYVVRGPLGGMAWSDLQYIASLKALGHDVVYVEDSDDYPSCYDPTSNETTTDPEYGLAFATEAMEIVGLPASWGYYDAHTEAWHGPLESKGPKVFSGADVVLNLAGVNPIREWAMDAPVRMLIDQDPAFTQIRNITDPQRAAYARQHNAFATFAMNIDSAECSIPDDGITWQPTRQPVMVEVFPITHGPEDGAFTTVMQWESYPALEFGDLSFGMKSASFEEYLALPQATDVRLELAVGAPDPVRSRLEEAGWITMDPRPITRTLHTYVDFIRASKGEFGIAKLGYVTARSGWFSERSLAYMANARPVVLQDTGFSDWLPVGEGVLTFNSLPEAANALAAAAADYDRHCTAARALAAEHFDGGKVVADLLEGAYSVATADHQRELRRI
jgi:hypothetical protein